ncbi:GL22145 [Drosophila persimilis]|uniref:GL22145 n=1 Tax=Drosophila persimilis TaxID=7234 RepID=B4GF59_DROPE|nr:GL22145 [Drosophila persimilis]
MEESIEALPAVQQVTLKPKEGKIISYYDVLSDSELDDLRNVVDDDDDDDEEEEDADKTVLLMNEALVLEAAFRLGMKHSTEWTLESDVDELEAEMNRARTTPLTDSLSLFLKRNNYLRLKDIRPSETLLSQPQHLKSRNLSLERCINPSGPSQKKRPCRSQQLKLLRDDCGTSSDSVLSPESRSSCVSGSRRQLNQHRLLSPNTTERLKKEMSLRVKLIYEALKDRPKSKAGTRQSASNSSTSSCLSSSDSDSSSASDSSCDHNTRLEKTSFRRNL